MSKVICDVCGKEIEEEDAMIIGRPWLGYSIYCSKACSQANPIMARVDRIIAGDDPGKDTFCGSVTCPCSVLGRCTATPETFGQACEQDEERVRQGEKPKMLDQCLILRGWMKLDESGPSWRKFNPDEAVSSTA